MSYLVSRFALFVDQIIILGIVTIISFVYFRMKRKWLNELEQGTCENVYKNRHKLGRLIGVPYAYIYGPVREELIFRMPIIVVFSSLGASYAWYAIYISAVAFALVHLLNKPTFYLALDVQQAMKDSPDKPFAEISEKVTKEKSRQAKIVKALNVLLCIPLGVVLGYYGIKHQSVYLPVAIHAIWNLLGPSAMVILVTLIVTLIVLPFTIIYEWLLGATFRYRHRRARRRIQKVFGKNF